MLDLEQIACPLCSSVQSRHWGSENGYQAVRCVDCGLVYVNPRPTLGAISEANRIGQHRTENGSIDVVYRRSERKVRHHERPLRRILAEELQSSTPWRWLDIGAGFGELVEAVSRIAPPGSRMEGIEPMAPKVEAARAHGLSVSSLPLSEVRGTYNQVSLINVLSHLPELDIFLGELRRVVSKDGVLLLETGNGGDLESADAYPDPLFLPDHLVFAGVEHVHQFLRRNGFQVIQALPIRRSAFWGAKSSSASHTPPAFGLSYSRRAPLAKTQRA